MKWQDIADNWWNGDLGSAGRAVKQFWAEQPKQTVEEIRATMVAKLEGLEQLARGVMAKDHYVVSEGRILVDHRNGCLGYEKHEGQDDVRCSCPRLIDDKPVYDGIAQVRQLMETQLKLIPGLAAPKRVEMLDDDAIRAEIERARAELEAEAQQLAATRLAQRAAAGDAGGAGRAEEEEG